MKTPVRILIAVLCAAVIVSMPFILSAPFLLTEAQIDLFSEPEDEEDLDFGRILFPHAFSEEAEEQEFVMEEEDVDDPLQAGSGNGLKIPDTWELPLDFSIPPAPDPDRFTEDGYEDQSIRVRYEVRTAEKYKIHIAYVDIASPTQLRTATAYNSWNRAMYLETMAKSCNAVIAMNGDLFIEHPEKKKFEYRMTQVVEGKRNKRNKLKDTLIIDKNGDFRIFLMSDGLEDFRDNHGDEIVNAFMFGPALVKDGVLREPVPDYPYNPNGHDPRSAIGQTGPLSYVMVIVTSRESGMTITELSELMLELGCIQAYNLDGGNTAEMIMIGRDPAIPALHIQGRPEANYRTQSDIIYFATAVPEDERE